MCKVLRRAWYWLYPDGDGTVDTVLFVLLTLALALAALAVWGQRGAPY
jgi:hypothetical protein